MVARGCAFGLNIALQAGRSQFRFLMVPFEYFTDILPAALMASQSTQRLTEMSARDIPRGAKGLR